MDTQVQNIKTARAEGMVCFTLDIHLWSGRKRLRKEMLVLKNPKFGDLPPESLATLGTIKIADPEDLHPFSAIKRKAESLLMSNGLPLLGTIAIPDAKVKMVRDKLIELQEEFKDLRHDLEAHYDKRIEAWRAIEANKEWAQLIEDIPSAEAVSGRLAFGVHMCRVVAPSVDGFEAGDMEFESQMSGLKGELFKDAEAEAKLMIEQYLHGKDKHGTVRERDSITQRTLRPLRRIGEKFRSFCFLDDTVAPLADLIEHCLAVAPAEGPITGKELMQIWSMARLLSNAKEAMDMAIHCRDTDSPADVLNEMVPEEAVKPTAPTQEDAAKAADSSASGIVVTKAETPTNDFVQQSDFLIKPVQDDSGPSFTGFF